MRLDGLIMGNDEVQQHVAAEREKQGLVAISPRARQAIKLEILPQIEESVLSAEMAEDLCNDTKRAIEAAFSYKNPLYTRLVSHKGIEQSDSQYLTDLLVVMDEWFRKTRARLQDASASQETPLGSKDQEVNVDVNVNVNGQQKTEEEEKLVASQDEGIPAPTNILKQEEASKAIQIKDTSSGEEIPVAVVPAFEFKDLRL